MRKIIFLDFDGVLNSGAWFLRRGGVLAPPDRTSRDQFDPAAIARLNRITDATGAEIVVSSSWRHGMNVAELAELLSTIGATGRVVGRTPDESITRAGRGLEILEWMVANKIDEEAARIVIIDDQYDLEPLVKHWIRTYWQDGLLDYHVDVAIRELNP